MQSVYGVHIRLQASAVECTLQAKSSRGTISLISECQPLIEGGLSLIHGINRFFLAAKANKASFVFIKDKLKGTTQN